jgi:hypothetical protein
MKKSLYDLQKVFLEQIFDAKACKRLLIYKNNHISGLLSFLLKTFPKTAEKIHFKQTALNYISKNPWKSDTLLAHYGYNFWNFIEANDLKELAILEWNIAFVSTQEDLEERVGGRMTLKQTVLPIELPYSRTYKVLLKKDQHIIEKTISERVFKGLQFFQTPKIKEDLFKQFDYSLEEWKELIPKLFSTEFLKRVV